MTAGTQFVFIIGAARSGTKFLRDLLGESLAVSTIPFDVNYVWRFGNEQYQDDALPAELATGVVRDYVHKTLCAMAGRQPNGADGRIIEKTVSNTLRVPFIYRLFPDAKYIHLIRDGRDVAESAARMWQAPPSYRYLLSKLRYFPLSNIKYAAWYLKNYMTSRVRGKTGVSVWGPRYPGIEADIARRTVLEIAARQWVWSVQASLEGLREIPASQQFAVLYEDLVSDKEVIAHLLEFIGVRDRDRVLIAYDKRVKRDTVGKWRVLDPAAQDVIFEVERTTLRRLGYIE